MSVVIGFEERQRERQVSFERKLLRGLAIAELRKGIWVFFDSGVVNGIRYSEFLEESCFDVAVEAYLLGGSYSKFGRYGESEDVARSRCRQEEIQLIDTLFYFVTNWGKIGDYDVYNDGLYLTCCTYVDRWWKEGFRAGEKFYKLRLH
jgi:Protein of unknown function (DUF2521)